MITVECFSPGGRDVESRTASRVVLKDKAGNPVVIAVVYNGDDLLVSTPEDGDWDVMLKSVGLVAPVVRNYINVPR